MIMISMAILMVSIVPILLYVVLKSPFAYPYFIYSFDVSGKRSPHIEDFLDMFLIDGGFTRIQSHQKVIEQWKSVSYQRIEKSILKNYRRKQYEQVLNDKAVFKFYFIRSQTRYRQRNYVKTAYKVNVQDGYFHYGFYDIKNRYNQLEDINFECTLRQYHSKNQ